MRMHDRMPPNVLTIMECRLIICLYACLACGTSGLPAKDITPLGMVENFESMPAGPLQNGFIDIHRWNEEFRQQARGWSSIEVVPEAAGKALRVTVSDSRAFTSGAGTILRLAPYFPPQADALRFRVRVIRGQFSLSIGGPTAYYANSDVFTEPQTVRATAKPEWVEIVCNFNHPTWRNYRRAGFSTDAPRNYYNRWAQEPVSLFLAPDSLGECLIDDIEVVGLGEGKPFAVFSPGDIKPLKTIADFEDDQMGHAFTLYMAAAEAEWFDESWIRSKPLRFEPMQLAVVNTGHDGLRSLQCRGQTAEEVHGTAVHAPGVAGANAISTRLRVEAPAQRNTLVGAGGIVPIDFLVFVAPTGKTFDWQLLAASPELRARGRGGFDYNLTHRVISQRTDLDFAIYQTRRYLPPGQWSVQVLPTADFTCIYGQGTMRERFTRQEPLRSDEAIAVAWINPWCRMGQRDAIVTTCIDELSWVSVPGTAVEHRSFWQVPDVSQLLFRLQETNGIKTRHVRLSGDPSPAE